MVARRLRWRPARARRSTHAAWRSSSARGLADKANRSAGSLTLLDRKRLELARALATQPALLLLDEIAGGLTEHECRELVDDSSRRSARRGMSIVWIEHVVHALLAVVDRLVVMHFGSFIAEGDPHAVMDDPQVARNLYGHRRPMPDAAARPRARSTRSTATSRRCSASTLERRAPARPSPSSARTAPASRTLAQDASPGAAVARARRSCSTAQPIGGLPAYEIVAARHRAGAGRAAGCFRRSRSRRTC